VNRQIIKLFAVIVFLEDLEGGICCALPFVILFPVFRLVVDLWRVLANRFWLVFQVFDVVVFRIHGNHSPRQIPCSPIRRTSRADHAPHFRTNPLINGFYQII